MADVVGIREYTNQARDGLGNVLPAGEEPALVATAVTATATSAQHTFNARTRFCLLLTEGIINFEMTADKNPTAVLAGAGRLVAGSQLFLGVATGGKDNAGVATPQKIAIIIDT